MRCEEKNSDFFKILTTFLLTLVTTESTKIFFYIFILSRIKFTNGLFNLDLITKFL